MVHTYCTAGRDEYVDARIGVVSTVRRPERPHDVVVLPEHGLARWLQRHPVTLSLGQVRHLAMVAAEHSAWQRGSQADPVDHAAFDRLHAAIE